ncbi:MAG TPA: FAD-binding oxidoreductase, partial [Verrucomicrobiales bacterium]|nr:FAD-binding oxidoreductase [Verrucomicrobiales bacterium]
YTTNTMEADIRHMKWWGWGHEDVTFDDSTKPELWPYLKRELGVDEIRWEKPVAFEDVTLPEQKNNEAFLAAIRAGLGDGQVVDDKKSRLVHAAGKSFRDLWLMRHGQVQFAPDCVVYPDTEEDVALVVRAAHEHGVVLVPFGGGSNIAGCLVPSDRGGRMVVSLDMCRIHRVLEVDRYSLTARIQPGVYGQHLEDQLAEHGVTLGHFPDSFLHSTLGGWVATRSAGMQSDIYGKIEDMVISLRMVTPSGTIITRTVPKSSNGIDIKHLCIGSEGILGVITEVVVQVHHKPEKEDWYGWLFPDFKSGLDAIHECHRGDCMPTVTRLNDPKKTALSFAFKHPKTGIKDKIAKAFKWYIGNVKKIDFNQCCLMVVKYEGTPQAFNRIKNRVTAIYKKHRGVCLGAEPGRSFAKVKFDFPHLRDYVMDRSIMADVSETATTWDNLRTLHESGLADVEQAIKDTGVDAWVGCHLSHSYRTGASLYFTFGCLQREGREIEQYLYVKKAAEDAFMKNGGTLSHHHAVGTEHLPWVEEDLSPTGLKAVKALKAGLDPNDIMNPGKIIPSEKPLDDWGLSAEAIDEFQSRS